MRQRSAPRSRRTGPWRERVSGTPRLVLAVLLLVAGTLLALTATAPPAAGPVVVAAHRVTAGTVLAAGDVTVVRRPLDSRPEGALTAPGPAVGHRVVATLTRGDVVTAVRLAPDGLTADLGPGRALATVTVAAARAVVVRVGDVLRLVVAPAKDAVGTGDAGATGDPEVLTSDARVLAVWSAPDDGATLVVDVDVGSASRLAVLPVDLLVGCVVVTA